MHVLFGGTKLLQTSGDKSAKIKTPDGGCLAVVLRTGFGTAQGKLQPVAGALGLSLSRCVGITILPAGWAPRGAPLHVSLSIGTLLLPLSSFLVLVPAVFNVNFETAWSELVCRPNQHTHTHSHT
jgi:magnesium-transporting ATPase (P-type)